MNEEALRDLFERATDLPPQERTLFLQQACGDDVALLGEVQSLLAADSNAANETFWQHSALRNQVISDGAAQSEVGEAIGQYRLVELIGKGGMGTVYRAERTDTAFDKSVAIKLINGLFHSADVINHSVPNGRFSPTLSIPTLPDCWTAERAPTACPIWLWSTSTAPRPTTTAASTISRRRNAWRCPGRYVQRFISRTRTW